MTRRRIALPTADELAAPHACTCKRPRLNSVGSCRDCGLPDIDILRNLALGRADREERKAA